MIDYAIASPELFPLVSNFYVDIVIVTGGMDYTKLTDLKATGNGA